MRTIIIYNMCMNHPLPILAGSLPVAPAPKSDASASVVSPLRTVRYSSLAIFAGAKEVEIEHEGALYRLRLTSLGKLILTK